MFKLKVSSGDIMQPQTREENASETEGLISEFASKTMYDSEAKSSQLSNTMCRTKGEGHVSVAAYVLVAMFNIAAWIQSDGIFAELPVLVHRLPEGWSLPSYFVIAANVAAVLPLIYFVVTSASSFQHRYEVQAAFSVMLTGLMATVLLIFLWNVTICTGDSEHSVSFLCLACILALTDSTSSLVFLGYMARFPTEYLTAYYVGDGLSGFLPSIVALIQGAGDYNCVNMTQRRANESMSQQMNTSPAVTPFNASMWRIQQVLKQPLFSVEIFIGFLSVMLATSIVAFALLNFHPAMKRIQLEHFEVENAPGLRNQDFIKDEGPTELKTIHDDSSMEKVNEYRELEKSNSIRKEIQNKNMPKWERFSLYIQYGLVQGLRYGFLYSIQSYSLLPYGALAYSLGNRLTVFMLPLASLFSYFFPTKSIKLLTSLSGLGTVVAVYIIAQSTMSPSPPLVGTTAGIVITVLCWIIMSAVWGYSKVGIAMLLKEVGKTELMLAGVSGIVTSLTLSVTAFCVVNFTHTFRDAPPCG